MSPGNPKDAKRRSSSGSSSSGGIKKEVDAQRVKSEGGEVAVPTEKRKPGQKYATPSPGQALRVFYETLLRQKPESHMAQEWCLAYGVCSMEEAEFMYKAACKRKGVAGVAASANVPPLGSSVKKPKKSSSGGGGRSRSSLPGDLEADTGFEAGDVFEGVGRTGL